MTLRTTSNPLDPLTLTEWRNSIAGWVGETYANMNSTDAAELNRYIEEAHDFVSMRFGHEPWALREWTVNLASGTATFPLATDVRVVQMLIENDGTTTQGVRPATKVDYLAAWGTGGTTHPWASASLPHYYFDGMTSDNPPVQQWKRIPTPTTALTITVVGRPYFGLIANDSYTELPSSAVPVLRAHIRRKWALYKQDYNAAAAHGQEREDEISALQTSDFPDGGAEFGRIVDSPEDFYTELTGP